MSQSATLAMPDSIALAENGEQTSHAIGGSRFWPDLWREYVHAPSVALCRVPELEYAATLDVNGRILDHCCGDGWFAETAWPGATVTAGCDIDSRAIDRATKRGNYDRLTCCDAAQRMPFDDAAFDLVFNNSALEHIPDLDAALGEIARLLRPGGTLAFSLLSRRFYDWWPLADNTRDHYRRIQPIHHAYTLTEWRAILARAGFDVVRVTGYFDRTASQTLARLDYDFCRFYLEKHASWYVQTYRRFPTWCQRHLQRKLAALSWKTGPDDGGGYFITARRQER